MSRKSIPFLFALAAVICLAAGMSFAQSSGDASLKGTLVVAVPVKEGLVVCADKRIFNVDSGTYTDDFLKIRRVNDKALFAATNTIGLYDGRKKKVVFDAFSITEKYVSKNNFDSGKAFWDGLKADITAQLRAYLSARKFAEWPESDRANNNLLFNLLFYSVRDGRAFSHSLKVFYEKAKTPVIYVEDPISEEITKPKLGGKGREVMNYLAREPAAARNPLILKFDETRFDSRNTTPKEAVEFAGSLFKLTSSGVPKARVSQTFDCALLDYSTGFRSLTSNGPVSIGLKPQGIFFGEVRLKPESVDYLTST